MRSHEEFKAELYRRMDDRMKAKALRNRIVTACISIALVVCLVLTLPGNGGPGLAGTLPPADPPQQLPQVIPEPSDTQPPGSKAVDLLANFIPHQTDGTAPDDAFINTQMKFSLDLLKQAYTGENTLISPLSVSAALSMTANGAQGDTLEQMEAVLCGGRDIADWNGYLMHYVNSLPVSDTVRFSLANSVWYDTTAGLSIEPAFLQTVADYYDASAWAIPFDADALPAMNRWIEENTDGMIKDAIDKLQGVMYLINALVFDGQWSEPYYEHQVRDYAFYTESGDGQIAQMMFSEEDWYLESEGATGFMKPYEGDAYRFVALLPREGITLTQYLENLTWEELLSTLESAQERDVDAGLPKFEYAYDVEMRDILTEMGMGDAFDERLANFTAMASSPEGDLYISRVLHKTFITVDGLGTKAGAATVVETAPTSAPITEPNPKVTLDRPFLYLIVDTETNLPIFIGTVTDLEAMQ